MPFMGNGYRINRHYRFGSNSTQAGGVEKRGKAMAILIIALLAATYACSVSQVLNVVYHFLIYFPYKYNLVADGYIHWLYITI